MQLTFTVNGCETTLDAAPDATLLQVLRDTLRLTGTKNGCSEGECGACTVLVDEQPINACLYPALSVEGTHVETIEGLAKDGELNPLQSAMAKTGGTQCGFCTPGIIMMLTSLLRQYPNPDVQTVKQALAGNICRCTGYSQINEAVKLVIKGTGT